MTGVQRVLFRSDREGEAARRDVERSQDLADLIQLFGLVRDRHRVQLLRQRDRSRLGEVRTDQESGLLYAFVLEDVDAHGRLAADPWGSGEKHDHGEEEKSPFHTNSKSPASGAGPGSGDREVPGSRESGDGSTGAA